MAVITRRQIESVDSAAKLTPSSKEGRAPLNCRRDAGGATPWLHG